jgi:hypothetical protein
VEKSDPRVPSSSAETPLVAADAPRPVFWLPCEHHRRRVPRSRVLDPPPIEEVDALRAQLRELASRHVLHRAGPLPRRVARLELERHAAIRGQARGSPAKHVGLLGLERLESSIVGAPSADAAADVTWNNRLQETSVLYHQPNQILCHLRC